METPVQTRSVSGVIGIDYNDGFMETAETNASGNLVHGEHIPLDRHGTGRAADSERKEKLSRLVRRARDCGKDIVAENLDFKKKKSKMLMGSSSNAKRFHKILHVFDYHRYLFVLESLCMKYGVGFHTINPAYTSQIGAKKYAASRKLTVHRAAAFVIARRGQGFADRLAT